MSTIDRRASVRALFARTLAVTLAVAASAVLAACGGGGGGDGAGPTPPAPAPSGSSLAVTADHDTTVASGATIALHATATGAGGTPTWTLAGPGRLDATTGTDVHYVPPDAESFDDAATVTITATLGTLTRSVTLSLAAAQIPGHHWTLGREVTPEWRGLTYGDGLFVAVGDVGGLGASTDGTTWTTTITGGNEAWVSAAWGPAGWVALGSAGQIATSPDGEIWTVRPAPLLPSGGAALLTRIIYGGGKYVAIADSLSFVSDDGRTWTPGERGMASITYGNGLFVGAAADAGVIYSSDATHWTPGTGAARAFSQVAFGNGRFVANDGHVQGISDDGKAWSTGSGFTDDAVFFGFVDGNFYATQPQGAFRSADGWQWENDHAFLQEGSMVGLAGNAGVFVGVLDTGWIATGLGDILDLHTVVEPDPGELAAVDFANGKYVAMSTRNRALTSLDGVTWTAPAAILPPGKAFEASGLAHAPDGSFVAVGYVYVGGFGGPGDGSAYLSSPDGVAWTMSTQADYLPLARPRAVVHDGAAFVSIDDAGTVRSSPTGEVWTNIGALPQGGGEGPTSLAHGQGVYVVVGRGGYVALSRDAKAWTVVPTLVAAGGSGVDLFGVTFDGTRFVAVGAGGFVATSTDGAIWSAGSSATTQTLRAVKAIGGELLAVGDLGAAQTSVDGQHWTLRPTALSTDLLAIAGGGSGFVAAGSHGSLQVSGH